MFIGKLLVPGVPRLASDGGSTNGVDVTAVALVAGVDCVAEMLAFEDAAGAVDVVVRTDWIRAMSVGLSPLAGTPSREQ